jgi:hypothetical protein
MPRRQSSVVKLQARLPRKHAEERAEQKEIESEEVTENETETVSDSTNGLDDVSPTESDDEEEAIAPIVRRRGRPRKYSRVSSDEEEDTGRGKRMLRRSQQEVKGKRKPSTNTEDKSSGEGELEEESGGMAGQNILTDGNMDSIRPRRTKLPAAIDSVKSHLRQLTRFNAAILKNGQNAVQGCLQKAHLPIRPVQFLFSASSESKNSAAGRYPVVLQRGQYQDTIPLSLLAQHP